MRKPKIARKTSARTGIKLISSAQAMREEPQLQMYADRFMANVVHTAERQRREVKMCSPHHDQNECAEVCNYSVEVGGTELLSRR